MKRQQGFALIVVVATLIVLAGMAAAMLSVGSAQQIGSAQDMLSTRAWYAAHAGNEWGLYQVLQNKQCPASYTLDLRAETGFNVTVKCTGGPDLRFREGEEENAPGTPRMVQFYEIVATACPAASCPASDSSVAGASYVERTRVVLTSDP